MGEDGEMVRRHRIRLGLAVIVLIAIFGVITFTVLVVAKALTNDGPTRIQGEASINSTTYSGF